MTTPIDNIFEVAEGTPADIPTDDHGNTEPGLPEMDEMGALVGGWHHARELLPELDAAPELIANVADAVFGLAITLDAMVRSAVPASVLLSYRAAQALALAKTNPAGALLMLEPIVDLGFRAAEALQAGEHERAAEILAENAGVLDTH